MKEMLSTFAFTAFLALVGLAGRGVQPAQASTDVNLVYLSTFTSMVAITTGTTVRIDNWSNGAQGFVINDRIGLQFQNQNATYDIWCLGTSSVSSDTTKSALGFRYSYRDFVYDGLISTSQMWCICADGAGSAGCATVVRQLKRN